MSSKKKVQFNEKRTYQKYDNPESGSEQSDQDASYSDEDEAKTSKKSKHSLDSDEEDNSDQYKALKREVFNDIGQEAKTSEFDDDIKLTPFNMKDELDEGDFDHDGYYHWKKDKDQVKDAWLDNIDWANINSLKKVDQKSTDFYKLNKEGDNKEEEDDEEESDDDEQDRDKPDLDQESQIETFKKIILYLKPGENILKAIKRLGNSKKTGLSTNRSSLSASQRWLKKKNQPDQAMLATTETPEETATNMDALEKLTGYANYFIDRGFYDIYEETFEKLKRKIEMFEQSSKDKGSKSFDIFADDINETDLQSAASSSAKAEVLQDAVVKWVYKLENKDDSPINGPFTTQKMQELSMKDEFKENGIWCRKLDDSSSNLFYNSKRIDFELYE